MPIQKKWKKTCANAAIIVASTLHSGRVGLNSSPHVILSSYSSQGKIPIPFCATEGHLGETPTLPTYSSWVNLIELHFSWKDSFPPRKEQNVIKHAIPPASITIQCSTLQCRRSGTTALHSPVRSPVRCSAVQGWGKNICWGKNNNFIYPSRFFLWFVKPPPPPSSQKTEVGGGQIFAPNPVLRMAAHT